MSGLPRIPADHEFLGFFQGCEPPAQFYDILTHRTFHYSLFFDPKPEGLGRAVFNGRGMEVDVASLYPILLQDLIYLTERRRFLVDLAVAEHHNRPPTNAPTAAITQVRFSINSNLTQTPWAQVL